MFANDRPVEYRDRLFGLQPNLMRRLACLLLVLLATGRASAQTAEDDAAATLEAFHHAASVGDFDAYFGLFAPEAVFLGTDSWERWTRPEFEEFARPVFARGRGWTYVPTERHITLAPDGSTAWFDEMLRNENLGTTRGSGVLVRVDGAWKVAQYDLSLPVPNELAGDVVSRIRALRAATRPPRNRIEALVDSMASSLLDSSRVAGLAVGVIQDGDTLVLKGYGLADLEYGIPTPAHAVFEVGSVTKQFTAAGILRLVERGRIDLGADFTSYLPGFDFGGRSVPVARLLDHTSGLQGYTERPVFDAIGVQDLPRDSLVTLIAGWPFWHEPGQAQIYNNSAYFLLGRIIESVTDTTYEAFLQDEFFDPLGMADSRYCSNTDLVPRRMHGYDWSPGGLRRTRYINQLWPYSAGSICSSVEDLLTWTAALHSGKVLGETAYRRMTTARPLDDGTPIRYGAGLALTPRAGRRAMYHGGGIPGFLSDVVYLPDSDTRIVVLFSTTGPASPRTFTDGIVRALFGSPEVTAAPLDVDRTVVLGTWVGSGRGGGAAYSMEEAGGSFVLAQDGEEGTKLVYAGGGRFVQPDGELVVEMRTGMDGQPQLHVDFGYGHYVLKRED